LTKLTVILQSKVCTHDTGVVVVVQNIYILLPVV